MASGIFISYRRDDAKHAAGRLVDRLVTAVGRDHIFMDVDNIEPGLDFVDVLNEQVAQASVLLALIGPGWLDARDAKGQRRLDNPADFVRIEIEAALARDIRVVPVLLDGAQLPEPEALPESLRPLLRRNAVRISHERFGAEADTLAAVMKRALALPDGADGRTSHPLSSLLSTGQQPATPTTIGPSAPRPSHEAPLSKPPHVTATQSQTATDPALGAKIAAALFALSGVPVAFLLANLSAGGDWVAGTNVQQSLFGVCVAALLISSCAFLLARYRGPFLTTFEATSYAFGSATAIGLVLMLVSARFWGPSNESFLFGVIFAILATLAFNIWWRRRHSRP